MQMMVLESIEDDHAHLDSGAASRDGPNWITARAQIINEPAGMLFLTRG